MRRVWSLRTWATCLYGRGTERRRTSRRPRRPDALAAALAAALDDPVERGRRAHLGYELIQEFTWDRAAAEFARVLEDLA